MENNKEVVQDDKEVVEEQEIVIEDAENVTEADITVENQNTEVELEQEDATVETSDEKNIEDPVELQNMLRKKDKKLDECMDKLKRNMAEFENYRRRNDKEKAMMYQVGSKEVVEKIIPIIDNFERAFGALPEDQKEDGFAQGMEMIYKQFLTTLTDLGVEPIEAVGKEFDPNFHNAVMHDEDEEQGENIVVEEFQKGYMYKDAVLRPSMVKVVN